MVLGLNRASKYICLGGLIGNFPGDVIGAWTPLQFTRRYKLVYSLRRADQHLYVFRWTPPWR